MTAPLRPGNINLTVAACDTAYARRLLRLNDPDRGVIVMRVRADTRRATWLGADLLVALGRRRDVSGVGRDAVDDRALAQIWLAASGAEDLIVTDLAPLPADVLAELLLLACGAGVRLWLVADGALDQLHLDVLADWPVTPVPRADFDRYWTLGEVEPASERQPEPVDDPWPSEVPDVDWPVYRAETRRQLSATHFDVVDTVYVDAFTATRQWVRHRDTLDEQQVATYLRKQLSTLTCTSQMTTVVRAVQAACFLDDWLIQVDLLRLLAAGDTSIRAAAEDPTTWRRLRAYPEPHRAVICALTAAGLDAGSQIRLTVGDVAADGTHVRSDGRSVPIHPDAAAFLRALLDLRRLHGATDDNVLLATAGGAALSAKQLATVLTAAARELGVALVNGQVLRSDNDAPSWLRRRGISVTRLVPDETTRAQARTARSARKRAA